MGSKRFVSAIEMGGSDSLSQMPTSGESRYGAPNFVEGTGGGLPAALLLQRESDPSQLRLRVRGAGEVALMYAAAAVSRTGFFLSSKTGRSASEISLS